MERNNILTITKRDGSADRFSLDKIMNAIIKAFDSIQRPVDLVENGCLLPFAEESVMNDRILIYEREN